MGSKKKHSDAASASGKREDKLLVENNDNRGHDTNKNDDTDADITNKATQGISKLTVESNGNISEEAVEVVAPEMPPNDNESIKITDIKIQIKEDIHVVSRQEEAPKTQGVLETMPMLEPGSYGSFQDTLPKTTMDPPSTSSSTISV